MKKIYLQIILLLNLFLAIIWYYPTIIDFLIIHNHHYSIPNEDNKIDLIAERGTFGDMFGLLNTVFSGIALLGVVYTLYDERQRIKEEKREEKQNKLVFLEGFISLALDILQVQEERLEDFRNKYPKAKMFEIATFGFVKTNLNRFNRILESLSEEEYYVAYIEFGAGEEILFTFDTLNDIISIIETIETSIFTISEKFSKDQLSKKTYEILELIDTTDSDFWTEYQDIFFDHNLESSTDMVNFISDLLTKIESRNLDNSINKSSSELAINRIHPQTSKFLTAFKDYYKIKYEYSENIQRNLQVTKLVLSAFQTNLKNISNQKKINN